MSDGLSRDTSLQPMFEELRGARVLLRPYTLADAAERYAANAESRDHLRPWEPEQADAFHTLDETRDWILRVTADWLARKRFSMGIWHIQTQKYLGGLGLHPREPDGWSIPAFSIGYWVRASEQGHGYVTEAVRLMTGYALTSYRPSELKLYVMHETLEVSPWRSALALSAKDAYAMFGVTLTACSLTKLCTP